MKIDPNDFPSVDASAAVVRLDARAPASGAWELLRTVTTEARELRYVPATTATWRAAARLWAESREQNDDTIMR